MQRDLVARAQAGDHDAFSVLVRASLPRLYAVASLILRDRDRAQDAVQEALVSAWRDVRALRDPGAWDAWLHRLTVRACYRSARTERRRDLVELHVVPDPEPAGRRRPRPSSVAERDRLGRELGRLPIDQRAVMVLHFYLDLPLTEAAEILDIPVGTAKSRLHRGLEALRDACARSPSRIERRPGASGMSDTIAARALDRRVDGRRGRAAREPDAPLDSDPLHDGPACGLGRAGSPSSRSLPCASTHGRGRFADAPARPSSRSSLLLARWPPSAAGAALVVRPRSPMTGPSFAAVLGTDRRRGQRPGRPPSSRWTFNAGAAVTTDIADRRRPRDRVERRRCPPCPGARRRLRAMVAIDAGTSMTGPTVADGCVYVTDGHGSRRRPRARRPASSQWSTPAGLVERHDRGGRRRRVYVGDRRRAVVALDARTGDRTVARDRCPDCGDAHANAGLRRRPRLRRHRGAAASWRSTRHRETRWTARPRRRRRSARRSSPTGSSGRGTGPETSTGRLRAFDANTGAPVGTIDDSAYAPCRQRRLRRDRRAWTVGSPRATPTTGQARLALRRTQGPIRGPAIAGGVVYVPVRHRATDLRARRRDRQRVLVSSSRRHEPCCIAVARGFVVRGDVERGRSMRSAATGRRWSRRRTCRAVADTVAAAAHSAAPSPPTRPRPTRSRRPAVTARSARARPVRSRSPSARPATSTYRTSDHVSAISPDGTSSIAGAGPGPANGPVRLHPGGRPAAIRRARSRSGPTGRSTCQ